LVLINTCNSTLLITSAGQCGKSAEIHRCVCSNTI